MNFKKFFFSFFYFCFAIAFISCQKDIESTREYPRVEVVAINDIEESGVTFMANVFEEGSSKIIEHGFVWGQDVINLNIEKSERIKLGSFEGLGTFEANATFGLEKDKDYYVKAFVRTQSHTVYSLPKSFNSLGCEPPIIYDFEPKTAGWGDTIKVRGKNFGFETSKITLNFDDVVSSIQYASDSLILAVVPINKSFEPVNLSLTVYGKRVVTVDHFTFILPQVNQIIPNTATFNDTITFVGSNFPVDQYQYRVKFDNVAANVISFSSDEIKVIVPLNVSNPNPTLTFNVSGLNYTFTNGFSLKLPVIQDLTPTSLTGMNRVITIYGNYFNPEPSLNLIKLGNYVTEIIHVTKTEISVRIPYNLQDGRYSLSINTGCFTLIPDQTFAFTNPWYKISDIGGSPRWRATAFSLNGKGYVGTGSSSYYHSGLNDIWEFNPETYEWTQKADFPGTPRANALSFSIGNYGYIGPSATTSSYYENEDMWEYNPNSDTWNQKDDYLGHISPEQPLGFSMPSRGYFFVGDINKEMWLYNPTTDEWTKKSSLSASGHRYNAAGFTIEGKIYVCNGYDANSQTLKNELWEYNPNNDEWTRKADFPGGGRNGSIGFAVNGKGYVGLGRNINGSLTNDIWEYDPSTDTWSRTFDFPGGARRNAVSFQLNQKAYIGTGLGIYNSVNADFWEFDPNRME